MCVTIGRVFFGFHIGLEVGSSRKVRSHPTKGIAGGHGVGHGMGTHAIRGEAIVEGGGRS